MAYQVKGKEEAVPIFVPSYAKRSRGQSVAISNKKNDTQMIGRSKEIQVVKTRLQSFVDGKSNRVLRKNKLLYVEAEPGEWRHALVWLVSP